MLFLVGDIIIIGWARKPEEVPISHRRPVNVHLETSQWRRLYVVVGPNPQSAKWLYHNQRETSWTTPHLKPIPQSRLAFSLQLHHISHSLLDWNSFSGHLITFWMFIVPLLQHLLHLLIPVTHFTSAKCLKMSEQNWSVNKWSTHISLISPVVRGSSPPSVWKKKVSFQTMFFIVEKNFFIKIFFSVFFFKNFFLMSLFYF